MVLGRFALFVCFLKFEAHFLEDDKILIGRSVFGSFVLVEAQQTFTLKRRTKGGMIFVQFLAAPSRH